MSRITAAINCLTLCILDLVSVSLIPNWESAVIILSRPTVVFSTSRKLKPPAKNSFSDWTPLLVYTGDLLQMLIF